MNPSSSLRSKSQGSNKKIQPKKLVIKNFGEFVIVFQTSLRFDPTSFPEYDIQDNCQRLQCSIQLNAATPASSTVPIIRTMIIHRVLIITSPCFSSPSGDYRAVRRTLGPTTAGTVRYLTNRRHEEQIIATGRRRQPLYSWRSDGECSVTSSDIT